MRTIFVGVIACVSVAVLVACGGGGSVATSDPREEWIKEFRQPDKEYSTENDPGSTAPFIRTLVYEKEDVRVYYKNDSPGVLPWKVAGFGAASSDEPLEPADAVARMRKVSLLAQAQAQASPSQTPGQQKPDDVSEFVAKYGAPDSDTTSEFDGRPLAMRRRLTYARQQVVMVFYPEATAKTPPPYSRWNFISMNDLRTGDPIHPRNWHARFGLPGNALPNETADEASAQQPADPAAQQSVEQPKEDRQPAAARKLKLARQVTDPARRRDWLSEIVKGFPETDAAREAAEDLEKLSR